jgi:YD repeat-containing protein
VYDAQNRLTSETHPESGTVQYTGYDPAGQLTAKVDANGTTFSYTYDARERLKTIAGGGLATTLSYEPGTQQQTAAASGDVNSVFAYDASGRLSGRTDQIGNKSFAVGYGYDLSDNLTRVTSLRPHNPVCVRR